MGVWTQLFPPSPHFTEAQTPSLAGKVFIVTGGNSGVGFELAKILYSKGGNVYIASRSATRIATAIADIKAQGHEMHMGTNCYGPYLLTKLLLPLLTATAQSEPKHSVRIVFTSSGIIDMAGPAAGLALADLEPGNHATDMNYNYSSSKAGNWFLAAEFDRRYGGDGIVAVAQSPGTLRTPGWDGTPWLLRALMKPVFREPRMGAYTQLWAGLGADVQSGDGGRFGIPWGRWNETPRKEHLASLRGRGEGGTGLAGEFFEYCERVTGGFVGGGTEECTRAGF
ncbi:NAD(P)-binding protein [Lophiostoma macrostomum CBS 122681]|uniref:NAD(P)-binding protein n=1 Tax=Lophiostoma macrostomum CBS 122681 TaxID=1314788 RepID=A0A6A6T5B0_9PLEO|nr:NAD(P)-binding protein [Lophiostoma macrostomum CBS 122681]